MDREEILARGRNDNKNRDLAEMSVTAEANSVAARVGAALCCLVSVLSMRMARIILCSPWMIYFGILGTSYLVRFMRVRRKTDLYLACVFFLMLLTVLVFFVVRLRGVRS